MKKVLVTMALAFCAVGVNAQYQVENSNFEQWEQVSYKKSVFTTLTGEEPLHWNSFLTASGSLKSSGAFVALSKSTTKRPGSSGSYSAQLVSNSIFGVVAQGNMTTGCVNMGSMIASEASGNYNYTDTSNDAFNQSFTGLPDAMHVWVKFTGNSNSKNAKATTLLHTDGYYQDPFYNQNGISNTTLVAEAINISIDRSNSWQELTVPFVYKVNNTRPAYALVSFSTSSSPGEGSSEDVLLIDDLEYLYYSELATAKYDGTALSFTNGAATVDAIFDASKLTNLTSNGRAAVITYEYSEASAVVTITVKGDDFSSKPSNCHIYTIQFKRKGDINGDNKVDMNDVKALVNIIMDNYSGNYDAKVAEIDGKAGLSIGDVTALVNMIRQ